MSRTLALLARGFPGAGAAPRDVVDVAPTPDDDLDEPEDARAQTRSRRRHERLMATLTPEERAPIVQRAPTADQAADSRLRVERDRRDELVRRCERVGVAPPDWDDAASVARARDERVRADAARERQAVQRDENGRASVVGSWLYGRFMTLPEVEAEFLAREGRPMGSPLSAREKVQINERPRLFRAQRRRADT